jgi:hypothetical protein
MAVEQARKWPEWVMRQVERRDSLRELPAWPEPPTLRPSELAAFMYRVPEPPGAAVPP